MDYLIRIQKTGSKLVNSKNAKYIFLNIKSLKIRILQIFSIFYNKYIFKKIYILFRFY
jgi:hypothetical protein